MGYFKKAASLGLAALLTAGLAACSAGDTKWVAKAGELTVPAGIYIEKLMGEYYTFTDKLTADGQEAPAKPLEEQVDGVPVPEAIVTAAKKDLDNFIAIEQKFDELGLTLTDADRALAEQNTDGFWQYVGATYTANGISKESYAMSVLNNAKQDKIFFSIYDEGGTDPVPESELLEKFSNDYAKIMLIPLALSTSEDETAKADADKATRDLIDEYMQKAKDGASMEDLAYEARKKAAGDDAENVEKPDFTIVSRENSPYDQSVTDAIFGAKVGEPVKVETDTHVYLFTRYDINEDPDDLATRRQSLIRGLRSDEFKETLGGWAGSLSGVTYNEAALSRYTPDKLKMD